MNRAIGLRGRVFASYLLLVGVVAGVGALAVLWLTPELFERAVRGRGGAMSGTTRGHGAGGPVSFEVPAQVEDAYDEALLRSLLVAALVGLGVAVGLGIVFSRRLLARLRTVQDAARRMAAGEYARTIPVPPEPELAELATSMNALGASLASTEQTRARLVSDLAHELRNPLTTIEGYVEGLIDGVLPPTVETYTEIAAEAHRLKRLTLDLSFLARAQEGAVDYHLEPADLAVATRLVVERLRPQFDAAGVTLDDRTGVDTTMPARFDAERIAQVLTNVLGNALAHTPAGGRVEVSSVRDGAAFRVSVADTGAGMTADQLAVVFDRYTRFHGGTGTGIGLNIARTIARAHHGDLTAASAGPGRGTTFTLSVPVAEG